MKTTQLIILLGILLLTQGCGGSSGNPNQPFQMNGSQNNPQATSVEAITIERADIAKQVRSFGNIQAQDIVEVMPQVSNRVTEIYSDLGDTVSQGQQLAKIYDVPFQDQYEQAVSQLEQSRTTFERDSTQFERQRQLYERELISASEFEDTRTTFLNSKSQLQGSQANLTQSREDLENTVIRSPVHGVVLSRSISEGDIATTGQAAFEIANLTGYETRVYLPVREWREVDIGQEVTFQVSNEEDIEARGRVARKSPRVDPTTGLGEVVIAITQTGPSIQQGVLVEARIDVESREDAVVIPRTALVENVQTLIEPESNTIQLNRTYSVFVVQEDSVARKRDVTLGIEQGDRVEVLSGLQEGDQIVVTGQNSLQDSTRVRIAGSNPFEPQRDIPIENTPEVQQNDTSSTNN